MGVLLALACALPLVTIFLFRRRLLQIRLCVVEMVLLLGSLVMEGVYYFLSWRVFSDLTFHTQGFKPAIVLPLVCLLFAYLAARAIFRDELLVRAAGKNCADPRRRILLTGMPRRMFRVFCPQIGELLFRTEKGYNSDRSDY